MTDATTTTSEASAPTPSSLVCAIVAGDDEPKGIDDDRLRAELASFLTQLGNRDDVFLLPPDYTRFHSQAGKITQMMAEFYRCIPGPTSGSFPKPQDFRIMPALGTHAPMTHAQIESMYGTELAELHADADRNPFLVHDWRRDVVTIGHVPGEMVKTATRGLVDEPWPAQLNQAVWAKRKELHDGGASTKAPLVVSIGQVVPHEVMGMANFNKNLFVGVGGLEAINLSHFIGAVYGMEQMMGRAENPLRAILNKASTEFLENQLDLWYVLTVVAPNGSLRGLFIGNTIECYQKACELSMRVNFTLLKKSPTTMVVHLDPDEFHSTWLGNKAIYRTRLAIADGGKLIVLAPGVRRFGEDDVVDGLIRKHGYFGTPKTMEALENDATGALRANLGAVAHLIHGSSEGRFEVVYCPGHLTRAETEGVGFSYAPLDQMLARYDPTTLTDGWNTDPQTGDEFFYISNPALGLWAVPSRFEPGPETKE